MFPGKQYLCLAMVITNGISDDPADNIQCVDVFSGPVILDCARGKPAVAR